MKRNTGELDRLLRTILGLYALLMGFLFIQGVFGIILGIVGLVVLLTGLVGWCPIYHLLKKSTFREIDKAAAEVRPEAEQSVIAVQDETPEETLNDVSREEVEATSEVIDNRTPEQPTDEGAGGNPDVA